MTPRRPSSRLFDGTAQAWEDTVSRDTWGGTDRAYSKVGTPFPCAIQVKTRDLGDRGPGEGQIGQFVCYSWLENGNQEIGKGMLIEVLTGPEAGQVFRVVNPYKPRRRFQQSACEEWDGELPEE